MDITKRQYYSLVAQAREIYKNSGNVSSFLRNSLSLETNTPEIIEISYDLQAGSYIENISKNYDHHHKYCSEIASHIDKYLNKGDSLIEIGCGEATTMLGVFQKLNQKPSKFFGFDISLSRIKVGIDFWFSENSKIDDFLDTPPINTVTSVFVADLFAIPLSNHLVDIVYTSHSIEPNGGREVESLKSIFRIAKKRVLLFEPCFEEACLEGQQRMSSHGYIKNLPQAIKEAGGILHDVQRLENISNPLNPTYLFDIEIISDQISENSCSVWVDPITFEPMYKQDDCFYSPKSGLAYPIIKGIPCLRPDNSILAVHLLDISRN